MLEAKLCGVGLLDPGREVLVSAHGLENDEKESRGPTTGAASVTKAG
jgi:hypothetical protein